MADDGRSLGDLAAVRSLTRAGWKVDVASPDAKGFAATSARVRRRHAVPAVHDDAVGFVSAVAEITRASRVDVVFAGGDAEVLALSEGRGQLAARLPYPDRQVVQTALDKMRMHERAHASGLSTPRTIPARDGRVPPLPVVVKASTHWNLRAAGAPARLEAQLCTTAAAVERRIAEVERHGGEAILQEHVSGVLMAYSVVCDRDGHVVGAAQQEVDGFDPSPVGSSTRARTVAPDPLLQEGVARMMRDLGWFGVAQLQFMRQGSEPPKLIDLNPRFYGSISLAIAAGVDLPLLWAKLGVEEPVHPVTARPGVRYQWFHGDLLRMASERRGGVLKDFAGTVAYATKAVHPLWNRHDPLPALRYLSRAPQRAMSRWMRP